jgi:hypothetical protein
MTFLKNNSDLLGVDPQPEKAVQVRFKAADQVSAAADVYNRLGRLLTRLCSEHQVEIESVIAVWLVQSSGRMFVRRRAQLHFEVEKFFEGWGHHNRLEFDRHFKFGGHDTQPGFGWENQEYREETTGLFSAVHHNPNSEYAALTMARTLAGDDAAIVAASVGGCLLSAGEYAWAGYTNSLELFEAFQESETAHILGFFDYCGMKPLPRSGDLLRYLKSHDWDSFARFFPAEEQTPIDPERLKAAYSSAQAMMRLAR